MGKIAEALDKNKVDEAVVPALVGIGVVEQAIQDGVRINLRKAIPIFLKKHSFEADKKSIDKGIEGLLDTIFDSSDFEGAVDEFLADLGVE